MNRSIGNLQMMSSMQFLFHQKISIDLFRINHSQVLNDKLLDEQKENPLHLVQEVFKRWNAT